VVTVCEKEIDISSEGHEIRAHGIILGLYARSWGGGNWFRLTCKKSKVATTEPERKVTVTGIAGEYGIIW